MTHFSLAWELLFMYVNFVTVSDAKAVVDSRITNYHLCLSSDTVLHTITGVSVKQCVEQCAFLSDCSAINFKRRYKVCELHSNLHGNFEAVSDGACVYVRREDMHVAEILSSTDSCQICEVGESTCEHNQCGVKVCPVLEVINGVILGNMKEIGSRVEITCSKYFKESSGVTHVFCQNNGSWTHVPQCTPSYIYVGCYEDREERILYERDIRPGLLTTEMCVTLCFELELKYALTEAGYACFCGNTLRNYPSKPEAECYTPCEGDLSEICGGPWRGSLYKHD